MLRPNHSQPVMRTDAPCSWPATSMSTHYRSLQTLGKDMLLMAAVTWPPVLSHLVLSKQHAAMCKGC